MNKIDVTKCEAYKYDKPLCRVGGLRGIYRSCLCKDNPNCHYKQLHRYKQTINEIKTMVEVIMETNKVYPLQNNLSKIIQKCESINNGNN